MLLFVAMALSIPIVAWFTDFTVADVTNVLTVFIIASITVLVMLIVATGTFIGIWYVVQSGLRRDDTDNYNDTDERMYP